MASGLLEIYLTSLSHRLNDVMKVLTIISTVFMPLSFLAGVYGMNFDRQQPLNMPELAWKYGYLGIRGALLRKGECPPRQDIGYGTLDPHLARRRSTGTLTLWRTRLAVVPRKR